MDSVSLFDLAPAAFAIGALYFEFKGEWEKERRCLLWAILLSVWRLACLTP